MLKKNVKTRMETLMLLMVILPGSTRNENTRMDATDNAYGTLYKGKAGVYSHFQSCCRENTAWVRHCPSQTKKLTSEFLRLLMSFLFHYCQ